MKMLKAYEPCEPKPGLGKGYLDLGTGEYFSIIGYRKQGQDRAELVDQDGEALEFYPFEEAWVSCSRQAGSQWRCVSREWENQCMLLEIRIRMFVG